MGSPEQLVESFLAASEAGIDGVVFGLLDYAEEMEYLERCFRSCARRGCA